MTAQSNGSINAPQEQKKSICHRQDSNLRSLELEPESSALTNSATMTPCWSARVANLYVVHCIWWLGNVQTHSTALLRPRQDINALATCVPIEWTCAPMHN